MGVVVQRQARFKRPFGPAGRLGPETPPFSSAPRPGCFSFFFYFFPSARRPLSHPASAGRSPRPVIRVLRFLALRGAAAFRAAPVITAGSSAAATTAAGHLDHVPSASRAAAAAFAALRTSPPPPRHGAHTTPAHPRSHLRHASIGLARRRSRSSGLSLGRGGVLPTLVPPSAAIGSTVSRLPM